MVERLIWRPNSFTPEEWDTLSREQQIQWWKNRERKGQVLRNPLDGPRLYRKGIINKWELSNYVYSCLSHDNIKSFFEGCPSDVLLDLRREVEQLPGDDDEHGWSQLIWIQGGSHAPWVTEEEIIREQQEQRERFRNGVSIFRKYLQGIS